MQLTKQIHSIFPFILNWDMTSSSASLPSSVSQKVTQSFTKNQSNALKSLEDQEFRDPTIHLVNNSCSSITSSALTTNAFSLKNLCSQEKHTVSELTLDPCSREKLLEECTAWTNLQIESKEKYESLTPFLINQFKSSKEIALRMTWELDSSDQRPSSRVYTVTLEPHDSSNNSKQSDFFAASSDPLTEKEIDLDIENITFVTNDDTGLYLNLIATNPKNFLKEHPVRGAGTAAIIFLFQRCISENKHFIFLYAEDCAIKFYEKMGFTLGLTEEIAKKLELMNGTSEEEFSQQVASSKAEDLPWNRDIDIDDFDSGVPMYITSKKITTLLNKSDSPRSSDITS